MVTRQTQKDVGAAEPKLIGPFTMRQCIFIGIGVFIGFVIYTLMGAVNADTFTRFLVLLPFAGAVISLGFIRPYGMLPEDYLLQYYAYHMLAPQVRLHSVKTAADIFFEEQEAAEGQKPQKKQGEKKKKGKVPLPKPDPDFPMYP